MVFGHLCDICLVAGVRVMLYVLVTVIVTELLTFGRKRIGLLVRCCCASCGHRCEGCDTGTVAIVYGIVCRVTFAVFEQHAALAKAFYVRRGGMVLVMMGSAWHVFVNLVLFVRFVGGQGTVIVLRLWETLR